MTVPRLPALLLALLVAACSADPGQSEESKEAFEQRMREIEQRIKDSMPKTQEIALKQDVDADTLRAVQSQLNVLKEYLDEPSGKMDFITVNAIQAFQRQVGFEDDGLLDPETLARLETEARKVEAGDGSYWKRSS